MLRVDLGLLCGADTTGRRNTLIEALSVAEIRLAYARLENGLKEPHVIGMLAEMAAKVRSVGSLNKKVVRQAFGRKRHIEN